jgi:hypothetical protein
MLTVAKENQMRVEKQPKSKTQVTLSQGDVEEGEMLKYDDDE